MRAVEPQMDEASSESIPLELLNELPTTGDISDTVVALRRMLMALLPEVDHAVICADVSWDHLTAPLEASSLEIVEHPGEDLDVQAVDAAEDLSSRVGRLLESFRANGHPVDQFQKPEYFDLLVSDNSIGTLLLWKRKGAAQLSGSTLGCVERLLPFIAHEVAAGVALHRTAHPKEAPFINFIEEMANQSGMSLQEWKVVTLRLLGKSYKDIAGLTKLSVGTVKKHIARAHTKAGVRSLGELVAAVFAPILLHDESSDRHGSSC